MNYSHVNYLVYRFYYRARTHYTLTKGHGKGRIGERERPTKVVRMKASGSFLYVFFCSHNVYQLYLNTDRQVDGEMVGIWPKLSSTVNGVNNLEMATCAKRLLKATHPEQRIYIYKMRGEEDVRRPKFEIIAVECVCLCGH